MARRNKPRRQRVALRDRRKTQLFSQAQTALGQLLVGVFVLAIVGVVVLQSDTLFGNFIQRHTPKIDVKAPAGLAGIPVLNDLPKRAIWLWIPGVGEHAGRSIAARYPAVRDVHFQRNFSGNHIQILLEPRKPLVSWGDRGIDGEGVVFTLPSKGDTLPKAQLVAGPKSLFGAWLEELARRPDFWKQVSAITENKMGDLTLEFSSGVKVVWGQPEPKSVASKTAMLTKVLEDAHEHLGGAVSADLRFFDEGRIIVKPKTVAH